MIQEKQQILEDHRDTGLGNVISSHVERHLWGKPDLGKERG